MVSRSRLRTARSFSHFFHSLGVASASLLFAIACGGGNSDGGQAGGAGASGSGAGSGASGLAGSAGTAGTPSSFTFGEPVTLADGQPVSIRIAQDDTSLYVTNYGDSGKANGSIVKVAKSDGVLETLAENRESPMGVAVAGPNVYWTEQSAMGGVFVKTAGQAPVNLAMGVTYPDTIAVDDQHLAWSYGPKPSIVVKDVSDLSVVKQIDGGYDSISQVLLDAARDQIIVVDRGATVASGDINSAALSEDRLTRLTPSLSTLQAAAIHGTRLFFAISGDGQVASLDLNNPDDLQANARGLNRPWGIAVDDDYFYVTERFSPAEGACMESIGTLKAFPIAGGEPTVLARDLPCPSRIVVDDHGIYWVNNGVGETGNGGSVMKVDKLPR
jgi:hypothetical protein